MRLGLAFLPLFCLQVMAQGVCAPTLPDWLLPSEEDYQAQYETHKDEADIFQRLHVLPLGDAASNRYVSIGGQERQWYESFSAPPFGNGPKGENGYLLQRYMLHFDFHVSAKVRVFLEIKGDLENGRKGGPRPDIDEDRGDFHQGFLEIDLLKKRNRRLSLRVGRQELVFGAGRLVDMREGPNVRRPFDAAKLTYCTANWRVDAFAARPVANRLSAFDDVPAHRTAFAGVYATRAAPHFLKSNIDLYYFAFDQKQSLYASGLGREQRHTIGTRIWKGGEGWDYDVELIDQFGRFGSRGIQAWAVSENTGYRFKAPGKPRLGFKTGIASGDSGVTGRNLGTFNPLFASLHYFGEEGLAGPANFFDARPELEFHPRKNVRVLLASDWFWRHRAADGVYLPGPFLVAGPNGSRARYIGNLSEVEVEWNPSPHWTTTAYYSHFANGRFLDETTNSHDLNYVAGWIAFHF